MIHRFGSVSNTVVRRLRLVALVLTAGTSSVCAQAPQTQGKTTELVVAQYEKLIANGALLTPSGWNRAKKLFDQSKPYPKDGIVFLTSTGGSIGETWIEGGHAKVETKWTDFFGSIDSALRYKAPAPELHAVMAGYIFRLVFTNRHRDIEDGRTISELTGSWEWKIEDPQSDRWATLDRAIEYVRKQRGKSTDAAVQKNATKTIAILKQLRGGRGTACAC